MYAHGENTNRLYIRGMEESDKGLWKDFLYIIPHCLI